MTKSATSLPDMKEQSGDFIVPKTYMRHTPPDTLCRQLRDKVRGVEVTECRRQYEGAFAISWRSSVPRSVAYERVRTALTSIVTCSSAAPVRQVTLTSGLGTPSKDDIVHPAFARHSSAPGWGAFS